jgi:DNA sulfur modification protein DndB
MPDKFPYTRLEQHNTTILLTALPAGLLTAISYAAVRGRDQEDGAVQRVLNPARISSIKTFTLNNGHFPNAIVLNWVSDTNQLKNDTKSIWFQRERRSAQIIDGQHRLAGIEAAIGERQSLETLLLPVVIYKGLSTQLCADIFLSINTEQKPAPKSLVYDLFGIGSKTEDSAALRARDIAMCLHESSDSPYRGAIKLPGSPLRKGGVALSTVVSGIKPMVEQKGLLEAGGVAELEMQRRAILNFFCALQTKYGSEWGSSDNAFLAAAGFMASMRFFRDKMVPYCVQQRDFSGKHMADAISLPKGELILRQDYKNLGGTAATNAIYERLLSCFTPNAPASTSIKF